MATRTRFAPSPTGDLHVGNARTALFSALLAERDGGSFILRIEDTDANRSQRSHEDGLRADLGWLGLRWQEGPDVGGSKGPYRQSERTALYDEQLQRLADRGCVYPCFCTTLELEVARKAQLAAGKPPRYAGTCAKLSAAEIEARLAKGLKSALRFRVPEAGETVFVDLVRGRQVFRHADIGDFIVRRADGSPAFFFSNAVDDALMGVTHVLRGEDHLANTPRQILILNALEFAVPTYGHLSLIVGSDGQPLSKRHGSASVKDLRGADYLPAAVLNYLARVGHSYSDNNKLMSFTELATNFDLSHIGHSPSHFDINHLRHWQKIAISDATDEELWEWLKKGKKSEETLTVEEIVPRGERLLFVHTIRSNILAASHIKSDYKKDYDAWYWAMTFFGNEYYFMDEGIEAIRKAGMPYFSKAISCLDKTTEYKSYFTALSKETGAKGPDLFMPFRAAITGETHGPELKNVWDLLGLTRIRKRLEVAASKI